MAPVALDGVRAGVKRLALFRGRSSGDSRRLTEKVKRNPPPDPATTTATSAIVTPMADRTFAKFSFFKIDPAWRRRDAELRAADKQEFLAACEDFGIDRSLRAYSTIGTRGDVDLVLLSQSPNLDDLHTFHVVLGQSGLAKWTETPYSFLSMTKRSPYSEEQARPEICISERKYLFLYPMVKQRRWYGLPPEERGRIMKSHIEVGRRYPEITINTTYSFGLDDQEFVVCFEGDDPGMFLDLVQRAAPDRVERVHRARDADLHLRGDLGRARRSTRSTASPAPSPSGSPS